MNDYKELIENVRICDSGDCCGCTLHGNKINCQEVLLEYAADAIEQLVKERAAAVADLKQHVYESGECFACRHYIWETDRCDRSDEAAEPDEDTCWEWRGCRRRTDES